MESIDSLFDPFVAGVIPKTKEDVYKIGKTRQLNDGRLKQYPKNPQLLFEKIVDDNYETENHLKIIFSKKFKNRNDIGYEYFEGDYLEMINTINEYLNEKVFSGNSGGCSDITLYDRIEGKYIFISSKYPKTQQDIKKQKSVDYYDIQNIIAMATKNKHIYKNYKIYLVVPNKKKVLDKVKNANESSEYITEHMTEENILDKDDLNKYFLAFKKDIIKNKNEDWQTVYLSSKENLNLRFHQELITKKTSNLIEEGNKSFLWGCKCRSGKTYMVGGIINKQKQLIKTKNKKLWQ